MLFYAVQITEDNQGDSVVQAHRFAGFVLLFLEHAGKMLHALGYSGPIIVNAALTAIRGKKWLPPMWTRQLVTFGSELDDDVEFSIHTTSEALREKPDDIAMYVLHNVLYSVNCPTLVDSPQKLKQLVEMGCSLNGWPPRGSLRT